MATKREYFRRRLQDARLWLQCRNLQDGCYISLNEPGNLSLFSRKVKLFSFETNQWKQIGEATNPEDKDELKYGVNYAFAKDSYQLFVSREFEVYGAIDIYSLIGNGLIKSDETISGMDGCLNLAKQIDVDNSGQTIIVDCSPAKIKIYKNGKEQLTQIGQDILLDRTNSITSISISGNGKRFVVGSSSSRNGNNKYGELRVYDITE